jgi:hypothetical protein
VYHFIRPCVRGCLLSVTLSVSAEWITPPFIRPFDVSALDCSSLPHLTRMPCEVSPVASESSAAQVCLVDGGYGRAVAAARLRRHVLFVWD